MNCVWDCHRALLKVFYNYGHFLGSHPYWFLIVPLLLCGALASGFMFYDPETDIEVLYAPMDSRAVKDRKVVVDTFPDLSATNYEPFSQNRLVAHGVVIFHSKEDKAILSDKVLTELRNFYESVLEVNVTYDGKIYSYEDLCARQQDKCAIGGSIVIAPFFKSSLENHTVTYPMWMAKSVPMDLNLYLSNVNVNKGALVSAGSLKLIFPLRQDTVQMEKVAKAWEVEYIKFMKTLNFTTVDFAFASSQSLNLELDKGTSSDIVYFSLTFTFMITFASLVSSGGDCVSTRALMVNAGVLAVVFGILGAFGVVAFCGVKFVNIVGVMPFLTLGIGVDDMFLLMGGWSESLSQKDLTIPERIGTVYKKAGIGITITSVTDVLAFAIGATSIFRSVRNFCIYTGAAVILCYMCNACVFGACLTLHGRRMYSKRHALTCRKVEKSRKELRENGHSCCYVCICGGKIPESADEEQSPCEKGPRMALVKFLTWMPVRCLILVLFAGYMALSIWGCTMLRQGLDLKDLVLKSSYFYKYEVWDSDDFGVKLPISFVTVGAKDYWTNEAIKETINLLENAKKDSLIDPLIDNCWLTTLAKSPRYNTTSEDAFLAGLHEFLQVDQPRFYNDIVFGADNRSIIASRCQAYSRKISDSSIQAELMTRMRAVADASPANVFAYHPAFVYFEQYVEILPSTLQTVGVTLAVMFVVTTIFLPHPMMVVLVMVQVVMIVTGIFGFMAFWNLTLSSVTMIHLIMSVGFSVDFCAHVCTAYMISEETYREERVRDAIIHAASPIFNGGISSLIGVAVLLFTESYIFQSFFKIMLLVIGFGVLHAILLIPVVLSFIGPSSHVTLEFPSNQSTPTPVSTSRNVISPVTNGDAVQSRENPETHLYSNREFDADAHLGYLKD